MSPFKAWGRWSFCSYGTGAEGLAGNRRKLSVATMAERSRKISTRSLELLKQNGARQPDTAHNGGEGWSNNSLYRDDNEALTELLEVS